MGSFLMMLAFVNAADKQCVDDADQKIYKTIKTNISNIQKDCIQNGAPGVDCVHKRTSLSTTCSSCFGQISGCVFKNCVMHCIDAKAPGCISCTKQYCLKDFVNCTGFDDLPPAGISMPSELVDEMLV